MNIYIYIYTYTYIFNLSTQPTSKLYTLYPLMLVRGENASSCLANSHWFIHHVADARVLVRVEPQYVQRNPKPNR